MVYVSQKVTLKSHVDVDVIHQQMKTCLNYPIQLHCVRRVILMMCELFKKSLLETRTIFGENFSFLNKQLFASE